MRPVRYYQRFFVSGQHSRYIEVLAREPTCAGPAPPRQSLAEEVRHEDALLVEEQHQHGRTLQGEASTKEVSPWLELTRWPQYLSGYPLSDLSHLAALPEKTEAPVLHILCLSLDRLIEEAYRSVCEDRINVFDQARINSFLQRPRASDRPLGVKLQKSTYRTYKGLWKRLLCFVYRTVQPTGIIRLRHQLTPR